MDPVVVAENVSRRYGETVALDDVSVSVDAGEVLGLIGPNGAGKTTLVRALLGTTVADGRVRLFGDAPTAADRERIGLLPQDFRPPERLTARELVAYYGGLYDRALAPAKALDQVGLADAADRTYEALSGGQQRRVCLATALVNDPDLLVLDEPTTGIDPAGRRAVWDRLSDLAAGGTAVVLTTHYMAEAEHLADRVGLLAAGELVALDAPEALVAEFGGDSLLRVVGDVDAAVAESLSYPAAVANGHLTVSGVSPREIGEVVDELEGLGVAYESLEWTEPDLEDVYLELAGRSRDDRDATRSHREVGSP